MNATTNAMGDLGFTVARGLEGTLVGTAAVHPEMHVPGTDVLRSSILASFVDVVTGLLAVEAVGPRVPLTLTSDVHLSHPPAAIDRIYARARLVHEGPTVVGAEVDLSDQTGAPFGTGAALFVVTPESEASRLESPGSIELVPEVRGRLDRPFAERAGCVRTERGVAVLDPLDGGLSASTPMHGGLLALAVEEAVLSMLPGQTLSSLTLRYLSPMRIGPAVATAGVHGRGPGCFAQVAVTDGGLGNALVARATARTFAA